MNIGIVSHNLIGMNAGRMLDINTRSRAKTMEKLSSGYRINRAADDAAGLAISETMRRMIRGLTQGTENAQDGISWVQTGDGALAEVDSVLHRMTELSVKALNDTWSEEDRALMQTEFEQLQKEVDRLTDEAVFNEQHIFADHVYPYYQLEGNRVWEYDQMHYVLDGQNDLTFSYRETPDAAVQTATVTVAGGLYTTKELIDEIDTALENAGLKDQGFSLEYTTGGTCNFNYDGGASIDGLEGGLSYLLYDLYEGGSMGSLIGTTQYLSENARLPIRQGVNDHMEFDIESLDGTTQHIALTIAEGSYTRSQLIDMLNDKLKDTSVKAVEYGLGIKLESDDSIITALKGNMFKVDDASKGETVFTSVFYDNIRYGEATTHAGVLTGAAVLGNNAADEEHRYFHITSANNRLSVQANGSDTVTELQLAEGYYTAEEMRDTLNRLFRDNGLDLTADTYSTGYGTSMYKGLIITSNIKGVESDVGIDHNSSAFDTLFVTRRYCTTQENETKTRDSRSDVGAYYRGGKTFKNDDWPFTIEQGINDAFQLNIDGKTFQIVLAEGSYDSASALSSAVNDAIAAAAALLTDPDDRSLLQSVSSYAESTGSGYKLELDTVSRATNLTVSAVAGNKGYADLFTTSVTYNQTTSGRGIGSATTNTQIDDPPPDITASKRRFDIYVNGAVETIYIPQGHYSSRQDLLDEINKHFKPAWTEDVPKTFSSVNARGSGGSMSRSGSGYESSPSQSYSSVGDSDIGQGSAGSAFNRNVAAQITISLRASAPFAINDSNNTLEIEINNVKKTITLDNGTYNNSTDLKNMLQKKLDEAFGTGFGGVDVSATSTSLTLKARLTDNGVEQDGKGTNIKCNTTDSSFLRAMNTTRTAASVTLSDYALSSSSTITGSNNTFNFSYKENGGAERQVSLTLTNGTYTRAQLRDEINKQLQAQGIGVTASLSGNYLQLTTNAKGNGCSISYDSASGGTCADTIFAGLKKTAASAVLDRDMESSITIDSSSNQFTVTVNGAQQTITLDSKTYSRADLVSELNKKFSAAGIGLTAFLDGNRLKLTTTATGSSATLSMTYAGGGSSMVKIFGTTPVKHPRLEASFDADNRLVITAYDENGLKTTDTLEVTSAYGSIFQRSQETGSSTVPGTAYAGYHSSIHTTVDGASLDSDHVTIDRWNKQLSFRYYQNGTSSTYRNIDIALDEKTYSYDELKQALQSKLDAAAGTGHFQVEVDADGVKISTAGTGAKYDMTTFSGGFYHHVLRKSSEQASTLRATDEKGYYDADVYAIGRKDIRHGMTEITAGVNDVLSLDFTIGNNAPDKIEFTIDAGTYSGAELIAQIQEKLNEQLEKRGYARNLIEVQIGGYHTGVVGSNDDNALVFKLSKHSPLPEPDVEYKIDGIGGKAAFSVFYQTDGDIRTAYVTGSKDISQGVHLDEDSELSFDMDGKSYTITVAAGDYTEEELLDHINDQLKGTDAPLVAKSVNGALQLNCTKYGKHKITNIAGSAKKQLFFRENGSLEGEKDMWINVGHEAGDGLKIERPVVNTVSLGINSLVVTKAKYATKALNRVKAALSKVSAVRSDFGAKQNRLEHTINRNENTIENMQVAESVIRDADIAKETVRLSMENILQNAGSAMLAHANQSRQYIVSLLQ